MPVVRIVSNICCSVNKKCEYRSIFSTAQVQGSWVEKVKNVFTAQKSTTEGNASQVSSHSFTLLRFADEMNNARRIGALKQPMVGRSSEVTFSNAFEKYEAIIRYLGGLDPTGENLRSAQKHEAAKHCNCTIFDVENALTKFTWAKEAQKKLEKLKEEGKPMPTSLAEVQNLVGSSPLDLAGSNLAQTGQISRNALCLCGSKKKYKWHRKKLLEKYTRREAANQQLQKELEEKIDQLKIFYNKHQLEKQANKEGFFCFPLCSLQLGIMRRLLGTDLTATYLLNLWLSLYTIFQERQI